MTIADGYKMPDSDLVSLVILRVHPADVAIINALCAIVSGLRQDNAVVVERAAAEVARYGLVLCVRTST